MEFAIFIAVMVIVFGAVFVTSFGPSSGDRRRLRHKLSLLHGLLQQGKMSPPLPFVTPRLFLSVGGCSGRLRYAASWEAIVTDVTVLDVDAASLGTPVSLERFVRWVIPSLQADVAELPKRLVGMPDEDDPGGLISRATGEETHSFLAAFVGDAFQDALDEARRGIGDDLSDFEGGTLVLRKVWRGLIDGVVAAEGIRDATIIVELYRTAVDIARERNTSA